ncbi:MAG: TrbI/VirB10 family protein [Bdellovibrionales bacterium]
MTEPELVTGLRYIKWKPVTLTSLSFIFLLMIGAAVFGQGKASPDYRNYQTLSADDVNKQGSLILSGKDEIKKTSRAIFQAHTNYSQSSGADQGQVISRKDAARSEYVIPSGSRVMVVLDGNLNSELTQSPVVSILKNGFSFQGRTLLPAGSKILGRVGPGQDSDRISVNFDQVVFPNGHQMAITGVAMMPDGSPGVVGEFHSGRGYKIAGALGSSFLAGAAAALQTNQVNMLGLEAPKGSTRNAILNGVAQSALEQGRRFGEEAQNQQGYVIVPTGTSFQIYIDREVDLTEVMQ